MFWPRLHLTAEEKGYSIDKYYAPTAKYRVLRRIYTGFLRLNEIQRQPTFGFQIARRCRVFAMTASGDIHRFRLQIQDSSGEQYFPDAVSAGQIFGGYNVVPPGANTPKSPIDLKYGCPMSVAPFVFEPNIVLDPNQVLNLIGSSPTPFEGINYMIEVCFHVWEFPAMFGTSPQ
jgi:hypothetical protein